MSLRIKAASYILCGDNIKEQLNLLDQATDSTPEGVTVYEPFENYTLENILSEIDRLYSILISVEYSK